MERVGETGRRSERITIELPIEVAGVDCLGQNFLEAARTTVLGRHGATVLLQRKLAPDQEVSIRCLTTDKSTEARLVGQISASADGYRYGVEFLDPEINLGDIEFPSLDEAENAAGRVLLECQHCHTREMIYLNEFEIEVLQANQTLSRFCKKCTDPTFWKESLAQPAAEPSREPALPLPTAPRTHNDRKYPRLNLKISACIRYPKLGEEVVVTENISRGGFRFQSHLEYGRGAYISAALPYSRDAANIFASAQIVYVADLPSGGLKVYGVSYLEAEKKWPRP